MLALFFALGASWEHLAHLAAFFVALGWFLWILDRSWVYFGGFQEGLGKALETPGPYFFEFFLRVRASNAKKLVMCKNHNFF